MYVGVMLPTGIRKYPGTTRPATVNRGRAPTGSKSQARAPSLEGSAVWAFGVPPGSRRESPRCSHCPGAAVVPGTRCGSSCSELVENQLGPRGTREHGTYLAPYSLEARYLATRAVVNDHRHRVTTWLRIIGFCRGTVWFVVLGARAKLTRIQNV